MSRLMRLVFAPALLALGCGADEPTRSFVQVDSSVVASATVVGDIDPSRTYEYMFSGGRPDSVLVALWNAGLSPTQAWRPIVYACLDALGPRITVELAEPDARIEAHDFRLGTGRLGCSEDLWRYTLGPLDPERFTLAATVRFVDLEGGCWALVASSERRFEPLGLPDEFKVDGLRVRATLRRRSDVLSVCMIAPIAEVLAVSRR